MKVRLTNIPPNIQKRYNIGEELEVETDNTVCGGHFSGVNKEGQPLDIDGVELSNTGILVEERC